jgi:hypothetical protein
MSSKTHIFKRSERAADSSFKKMQMVPQTWNKSMSLWVIRDGVEPAASPAMSASLIGHSGVKHFQTIPLCGVDVSRGLVLLFGIGTWALPSWDSRTRWNNLYRGLAVKERQIQADMRTHLIHRPARDIFPPLGEALVFSYRVLS